MPSAWRPRWRTSRPCAESWNPLASRPRIGARAALALAAGCAAALLLAAEPAGAATRAAFGCGYDLTNVIYYEQTFDSTAFTSRETVDNPISRLQALISAEAETRQPDGSRGRLGGRLSLGEQLFLGQATFDGRKALAPSWRAVVNGSLQYRDDSSFGTAIRDFNSTTRLGAEHVSGDLATSWRALYLFDYSDGKNADGTDYTPDYSFHRLAFSRDHFGWDGREWGVVLYAGERTFPDTSVRNYLDFAGEGRFRSGVGTRGSLQALGTLERRMAHDEAATGDRFWAGDLEVQGHVPIDEGGWSIEGGAGFRGVSYDQATPTYFHHTVWQADLGMRYEELPDRLVRIRAAAEFLRVPNGGGLGDPETDPAARSAVAEEYDQLAGRLDTDLSGGLTWVTLAGAFGRRDYGVDATVETDLVARSSYWFTEIGGFTEFRIGRWLRLRLGGDVRYELHDVSSDDLTNLYLGTELHYLLGP